MENSTENVTLESMIAELGGTPPTTETPSTASATSTAETTEPEASTEPVSSEASKPSTDTADTAATEPATESKPDKAAQTFAAMRIQNKKQSDMLKAVASLFEVDPSVARSEEALLDALQAKLIEKQAAKENLPAPVLAELTQLRQIQHQQRNAEVAIGFQRVKDTFGLKDADITRFAEELIENGMNPLEQTVDLVKQYKSLHFDELVEKAKQEAIIAEQNRVAKASTQSSTPSSKQGAGSAGEPAKVSNIHELNAWLDSKTKK